MDIVEPVSATLCAICGNPRYQHNIDAGVAYCPIYATYREPDKAITQALAQQERQIVEWLENNVPAKDCHVVHPLIQALKRGDYRNE